MRICVFDDNEVQLRTILRQVEELAKDSPVFRECEVCGFSDIGGLEADIAAGPASVYLLDIGVPGNETFGIEAAKNIRARHKDCHIVFLTAFGHLMGESMQGLVRPSGYICKGPMAHIEIKRVLTQIMHELSASDRLVCLTQGRSKRYEPIDCILYARYDTKIRKTEVMLVSGGCVTVAESLSHLHKRLGEGFSMVNRRTLVHNAKIRQINAYANNLTLVNGEVIGISRGMAQKLKNLA